jgi:hypothetical protein
MEAERGRMGSGRVEEANPERGRPAPARPMRKVEIVYYLCRNGQLEHPHFMELARHPHQPLRLKGTSWTSMHQPTCIAFPVPCMS